MGIIEILIIMTILIISIVTIIGIIVGKKKRIIPAEVLKRLPEPQRQKIKGLMDKKLYWKILENIKIFKLQDKIDPFPIIQKLLDEGRLLSDTLNYIKEFNLEDRFDITSIILKEMDKAPYATGVFERFIKKLNFQDNVDPIPIILKALKSNKSYWHSDALDYIKELNLKDKIDPFPFIEKLIDNRTYCSALKYIKEFGLEDKIDNNEISKCIPVYKKGEPIRSFIEAKMRMGATEEEVIKEVIDAWGGDEEACINFAKREMEKERRFREIDEIERQIERQKQAINGAGTTLGVCAAYWLAKYFINQIKKD